MTLRLELYQMGVPRLFETRELGGDCGGCRSIDDKKNDGWYFSYGYPFPDTDDLSGAWKVKSMQRELQTPGGRLLD